jgi:hypothetical protein
MEEVGMAQRRLVDYLREADRRNGDPPPRGPQRRETVSTDEKPTITIRTEEYVTNDEAMKALASDTSIYQRGGLLVRIVRDASPAAKGIRRPISPRIEELPAPLLRERLTAVADWKKIKETKYGAEEQPAHPPAWCISALHARAEWPGIHHLEAVVDYPVVRSDGEILSNTGYDLDTGLFLETNCSIRVGREPSRDDAVRARDLLLEVVVDFPFALEIHKAAWLCALLSPLARFAFNGPSPLFLVDSNVRAAGKGLLLDTISRIITGERFTVATYTENEEELRKRITSLALSGERLVLFDNLQGKFGSSVLDAALTGTSWQDRLLKFNRIVKCPLYMTWYATGNNVTIAGDTPRRICHVRLESELEKPEERNNFRHHDLLAWVGQNRADLLAAALTILRAYFVAGCPDMRLSAWGSFEGWSRLVRAAVVWIGMPDPGETRILLQDQADFAAEAMGILLSCWQELDPDRRGLTTSEVIDRLRSDQHPTEADSNCRAAIETLVGKLDARSLGYKLRQYRRRNFGGKFFDRAGAMRRAIRWAVYTQNEFASELKHPHHPHILTRKNAENTALFEGGCEDGEDVSAQAEEREPGAEG